MTLTEDTVAILARNLTVGMEILFVGSGWVTITDIQWVPPSIVRISFADSKGTAEWFYSGLDGLHQAVTASQIAV